MTTNMDPVARTTAARNPAVGERSFRPIPHVRKTKNVAASVPGSRAANSLSPNTVWDRQVCQ